MTREEFWQRVYIAVIGNIGCEKAAKEMAEKAVRQREITLAELEQDYSEDFPGWCSDDGKPIRDIKPFGGR